MINAARAEITLMQLINIWPGTETHKNIIFTEESALLSRAAR